MKLLPSHPRSGRVREHSVVPSPSGSDSLGRGMDLALTVAAFIVVGWLLDRWLGTAPVFVIVMIVVSAVGQFIRMKVVYDAQMERLEAERLATRGAKHSGAPVEDIA